MKISVILGHPYEKSLNAAIAETVRRFYRKMVIRSVFMTCTKKSSIR